MSLIYGYDSSLTLQFVVVRESMPVIQSVTLNQLRS
jgi:hypothetical protein